ncbi:MAG: PH domain-containing protein [Bacteroidota bacterium]|nr:PH domain-containing protein [Bacteroidota bacterium]
MRDLSKPQRQALAGVGVMFFRNLRVAINLFIFILIPVMTRDKEESPYLLMITYGIIALILILMALLAWYQYRRFYFQVQGDKFLIHKGVFRREKTTIPFDRIQSVQLKQNLIQQVLNVVGLVIDTAGSGNEEVGIPALSRDYAEDLKAFLLAKKKEAKGEDVPATDEEIESEETPVLELGLIDLFKVGLTENHIRTGLVALAVSFSYFSQYAEYFGQDVEETTLQVVGLGRSLLIFLPLFLIIFILLSILLSTLRTALKFFNLKMWLNDSGLRVVSGLLKRQEYVVPSNKIQFIRWRSNPLRRMIGYRSLSVYQATSSDRNASRSIEVPGCKKDEVERVTRAFFPDWKGEEDSIELRPDPFYFRRLWMFTGILPTMVGVLISILFLDMPWWFPLIIAGLYLPLSAFLAKRDHERRVAWIGKDVMALDRGFVFPQRAFLKIFKVQNLVVHQSIWQKRRGLVSLTFHTAAGSLRIPYINERVGYFWANRVLYQVEISQRDWM